MIGRYVWPLIGVIVSACAAAGPSTGPAEGNGSVTASDAAVNGTDPESDDSGAGSVKRDAAMSGPDDRADATVAATASFPKGEGVKNAIDRSAPCASGEQGMFRNAPEDHETIQACLPNYSIWAPVVCGGPQPPCSCEPSRCANGEVAKAVSGSFCVCLSPCSTQINKAACGASAARRCIAIDDTTGTQVFICGGT